MGHGGIGTQAWPRLRARQYIRGWITNVADGVRIVQTRAASVHSSDQMHATPDFFPPDALPWLSASAARAPLAVNAAP
ncbi:hypothetical protein Busp01_12320 [Trinickia caryophylli]|nr:hypothetical protein Busp01_12320 [Trinickia caryophylli]